MKKHEKYEKPSHPLPFNLLHVFHSKRWHHGGLRWEVADVPQLPVALRLAGFGRGDRWGNGLGVKKKVQKVS